MSDKKQAIAEDTRRSVLYMLQMLVTAALPLAVLPIVTRMLTPEEYGKFSLSLAFSTIMVGVISLGLVETIERNYYDHKGASVRMASLLMGNILVMTIMFLGTVALFSVARFFTGWSLAKFNLDYILLMLVFSGSFLVSINTQLMLIARNEGRAARIAIISIATSAINALVVVTGLLFSNLGVYTLGYGILAANVFAVSVYSWLFVRDYGWALNLEITLESISKGIWLLPRTLAGSLNTQLDKLVLNIVGSTSAVGIYAIGQRLANGLFLVMNALQHVFTPRLYSYMLEDEKQENGNRAGNYLGIYFFLIAGIAIFAISVSGFLIKIVAPASYFDSETVFILLIWMYFNFFFGKVAGPQILLNYKTKLITLQAYIYLLLNAIFMVPLASFYGINGAAAGALIAGTLNTGISVWMGQKQYRIEWPIYRLSITYLVFMLVVLFKIIMVVNGANTSFQIVHLVLATIGFILAGKAVGILSQENIRQVMNLGRRASA